MARLGRRQPFKPIMNRLIQYQPALPPAAARPLVVSLQAVQAPVQRRVQYRRFPPILKTFIQYIAPVPKAASQPFVVSRQAVATARAYRKSFPAILKRGGAVGVATKQLHTTFTLDSGGTSLFRLEHEIALASTFSLAWPRKQSATYLALASRFTPSTNINELANGRSRAYTTR